MSVIPELSGKEKICYKCGAKNSYRFYVREDIDGYLKWECGPCHNASPESHNAARKSCANWRNKNLDPDSKDGKGFIGEMIIAKALGLRNCNLELNNFHAKFDLSLHRKHGKIQVKTASLKEDKKWDFGKYLNKNFDTLFLVCMDSEKPWKDVERIYIILVEEAVKRTGITVYKNPTRTVWYEKFRKDEKLFNNIYHKMKLENCSVLSKRRKNLE